MPTMEEVLLPSGAAEVNLTKYAVEYITYSSPMSTAISNVSNVTSLGGSHVPWYVQTLYIIFFVSMVVTATAGNLIVIWIVLAHRRMRSVTNFFLVNLAVADALNSIFNTFFNFIYMLYGDWPFGLPYCRFSRFIELCTIGASVFTFVAIAIDRYSAIMHPLRPRMTAKKVSLVILLTWVVSVAIAVVPPIFSATFYSSKRNATYCYVNWTYNREVRKTIELCYNIFLLVVTYVIPFVVIVVTYSIVGVELWGSKAIGELTGRQLDNIKAKRKVVKMMIIVVMIFGICWLPQNVYMIWSSVDPSVTYVPYIEHIYLVIFWIAMSNSMYNPFIYCWMNARFRLGFRSVFRWLPCVKWDPEEGLNKFGATTVRFIGQGSNKARNNSNGQSSYSSTCAYKQCTLITQGPEESSQ